MVKGLHVRNWKLPETPDEVLLRHIVDEGLHPCRWVNASEDMYAPDPAFLSESNLCYPGIDQFQLAKSWSENIFIRWGKPESPG